MIKIAFSFDDGRHDNYIAAKEILCKYQIPATFNITTGYIEDSIQDNDKPSLHKPMTISELKELHNNELFEIAGHGYTHDNEQDNLIYGIKKLRQILNANDCVGIASPHSEFDLKYIKKFEKKCEMDNIRYLRISHNFKNNKFFYKFVRKINRNLNIPYLYYLVYKNSFVIENAFLLHSVPVIKDNKIEEIKYFVEKAISDNKSYIFMFHSILKEGDDYYDDLFTWDYNDFKELCIFLKKQEENKKLKICKVKDIIENEREKN